MQKTDEIQGSSWGGGEVGTYLWAGGQWQVVVVGGGQLDLSSVARLPPL